MAHGNEDAQKITEELTKICESLDLTVYDKKGFFEYIAILNKEANGVFEFDEYVAGDFKKKYGV